MLNKLLPSEWGKALIILLQVSLRGLRASTDGHREVLVIVSGWASLEEVGACLINGAYKEADTEGSLSGMVSLYLGLLGNLGNQTLGGMMAIMGVPIVEAL